MSVETRFAVNVSPKPGILDPQGRAVESSLGHLGIAGVSAVRVGRRIELTVAAGDDAAARDVVERLASELLSNPLIEAYEVEVLGATSSASSASAAGAPFAGRQPAGNGDVAGGPIATPEGAAT